MRAWHFLNNDRKLGYNDNRIVEAGKIYSCEFPYVYSNGKYKKPTLCSAGMHASINVLDALDYAPGSIITLVNVTGNIEVGRDKIVGTHREVLNIADATNVLFEFSCVVAENALNLIKKRGGKADKRSYAAIKARRDYQNGIITKEDLAAASAAASAAAEDAAWDAAWDAVRAAAWATTEAAVRAAAWATTEAAARDAARAAAWDATGDAVRAAAWATTEAAASAAASATTGDAARDAAWDAAWDAQNKLLEKMLMELFIE